MCSSPGLLLREGVIELAVKYAKHPPAHWIHTEVSGCQSLHTVLRLLHLHFRLKVYFYIVKTAIFTSIPCDMLMEGV